MANFIHRWLNPHCPDCALEKSEQKSCSNCDMLKILLEQERHQNQILLGTLIARTEPVKEEVITRELPQPINPQFVPWRVRQRELENADRKQAEEMKKKVEEMKTAQVDVSELEKQIGMVEESSSLKQEKTVNGLQ